MTTTRAATSGLGAFLVLGASVLCASPPYLAQEVAAGEGELLELDGQHLYARNCESCHGANGDGRGTLSVQLGKPARSFADGGFAFGNTREAIFRTVSSGIPGRSVMPGFRGVLDEQQRWAVVDHVLTLVPEREPDDVSGSVMVVGDRPAVVRGHLPPAVEGAPERVRGLLIGMPEGLTFEYRLDDVRLLAVRQGGFVDRADWAGRGGAPLRPLGQVVFTLGGGDPEAPFQLLPRATAGRSLTELSRVRGEVETRPAGLVDAPSPALFAKLSSTWVRGAEAGLDYALFDEAGRKVALVQESNRAEATSVGSGFTRLLSIYGADRTCGITVDIAGSGRLGWPADLHYAAEPPGAITLAPIATESWAVSEPSADGGERECVFLRVPEGVHRAHSRRSVRLLVALTPGARVDLQATVLSAGSWSQELRDALTKELHR